VRALDPVTGVGSGVGGIPPYDDPYFAYYSSGDPRAPYNWVDVSIGISATPGNVDRGSFLEYHVYRRDYSINTATVQTSFALPPCNAIIDGVPVNTADPNGPYPPGTNSTWPLCYDPTKFTETITSTVPVVGAVHQLPIMAVQTEQNLQFANDGTDDTFQVNWPSLTNPDNLDTFNCANAADSFASSTGATTAGTGGTATFGPVPVPACHGTGLPFKLVGQRFQYFIEGLWTITGLGTTAGGGGGGGGGTAGGAALRSSVANGGTAKPHGFPQTGVTYQLTGQQPTNFVTYMQPPALMATPPSGCTPDAGPCLYANAGGYALQANATEGGNDYVLQVSAQPNFADAVVYRPNDPSVIQPYGSGSGGINGGIEAYGEGLGPRDGPPFAYFGSTQAPSNNLCVDATGSQYPFRPQCEFPNSTILYVRFGARDSRNGSSSGLNPYLFSDPIEFVPSAAPESRVGRPNGKPLPKQVPK
jgi:hypothetical protein